MYKHIIPMMIPHAARFFTDDFDDNVNDPAKWTVASSADLTVLETSGEKRIAADSSFSGSVNVATATSVPILNLTGKSVQVDLPQLTGLLGNTGGGASGGSFLVIQDTANSNNSAIMGFDGGSFYNRLSNNGTNSQQVVTNTGGALDAKWKMTHDSVNTKWLFYTWNGSSWVLRFTSATATWSPTSVRVILQGYIYGTNQQGVTSRFDNLITDAIY